jgi:hypothetical protein
MKRKVQANIDRRKKNMYIMFFSEIIHRVIVSIKFIIFEDWIKTS